MSVRVLELRRKENNMEINQFVENISRIVNKIKEAGGL